MGVKFSPIGNGTNWIPGSGLIANGYKLFFYAAGTTTKQDTFTTYAGSVANSNPITLNSYGRSATEIWLTEGLSYKVVIASGSDTDPPDSGVTLGDYITGINDSGEVSQDQWIVYGAAPTYISATSFSVTGDQTATFHIGRRVKTTNTGGTRYSTITNSVYASVTTITVTNDSGSLDSGISAVSYGILSSSNPSVPKVALPDGSTATTQAQSDVTTKIATNAYASLMKDHGTMGFRLTLTSGTPVTTSDVTAATTVYMTPYTSNKIGLYNGTTWDLLTTAEISNSLGTLASGRPYDIFCYNNSGTPTLEKTGWTNSTTRGTALTYQDGVLVKSGDATRRYIGTFYTTSTTTTEDSEANRYLFNYYNRHPKRMRAFDATASWTYSTDTWRQANGSTSNQLNFIIGVLDQSVHAQANCAWSNNNTGYKAYHGMGLNSTSATTGPTAVMDNQGTAVNYQISATVSHEFLPILGVNYISKMERAEATGTSTWIGTGAIITTGISGSINC